MVPYVLHNILVIDMRVLGLCDWVQFKTSIHSVKRLYYFVSLNHFKIFYIAYALVNMSSSA